MDLRAFEDAQAAIKSIACRTPLVETPEFSDGGRRVLLKLETAQPTGAFKLRGAANALSRLSPQEAARGVVCASTGNHGRALAYAADRLGIPATVCMSKLVPQNKIEAVRKLGAKVSIVGKSQDDAQAEVDRLVSQQGLVEIPPFDHAAVIAGQGTIGLEILEDAPETDTILVPLSGGGLIAGIAAAAKAKAPGVRVIGLSMERGAAMAASLSAGHPVDVVEEPTLADSLGGGIGLSNRHTFSMVRDLVDDIVLLTETQIAAAMRTLFLKAGWVAEGAGAVGIAALIEPGLAELGRNVAVVISGRNVDMDVFRAVIDGKSPEASDA
ncbi:hydroxyectoine utilization dehydratase EutB [Devosia nitrariae]|uniref:Hydroxyectoine utilization dehydratase EutB n=1 Tax=Devosia nitrariae TaxID=2071872 RepID=A0ABQ5WA10_9HYPH|nr:hydroxyectoine utilization dehydratase EutB [Devosia nitrariae]GLQ56476.1 hydroxyectoine utilization dehydratase EutB [Devosia nitrariae]